MKNQRFLKKKEKKKGNNFDPLSKDQSYSKGKVNFDNALLVDGWRFQWNGEGLDNSLPVSATALASSSNKINWSKIFYPALVIVFVLIFMISVYKKKKNESAT